jgi:hypothetical protein
MRWFVILVLIVGVACSDTDKEQASPQTPEQLARQHCPEAFREPCTAQVVQFANGQRPAALCVDGQQWYMETPQGAVGARCTNGGTITVIVGGS